MRIGIGDITRAAFAVPQTPVGLGDLRDFVPGSFAVPQNPVGVGDLLSTVPMYPIPKNSVMQYYESGGSSYKGGISGLGCGCGGSCGCGCGDGTLGMGDFSIDGITSAFTTAFTDAGAAISQMSLSPLTPTDYMVLGGTAVAAMYLLDFISSARKRRR